MVKRRRKPQRMSDRDAFRYVIRHGARGRMVRGLTLRQQAQLLRARADNEAQRTLPPEEASSLEEFIAKEREQEETPPECSSPAPKA